MFACIYFVEDASLSVVNVKDKKLNWQEENDDPNPRSNVTMKWGKTNYNGTVIKLHDNEEALLSFATKADAKLRRKYVEKPNLVPEELFGFELENDNKNETKAKRSRTQTERFKESKKQEAEISPKKKKKESKSHDNENENQGEDNEQKTEGSETSPKKKKKDLKAGIKHDNQKKGPNKEKNEKKKCESAASLASSLIMCDLMSQVAKHREPDHEINKETESQVQVQIQNVTREDPAEDQTSLQAVDVMNMHRTPCKDAQEKTSKNGPTAFYLSSTNTQYQPCQPQGNFNHSTPKHNTQYQPCQPQGNFNHSTPKHMHNDAHQGSSMHMSSQSTNFSYQQDNQSRHTSYPSSTGSNKMWNNSSTSLLETWDLVSNCTGASNFTSTSTSSHHNSEGSGYSGHSFIQTDFPAPPSEEVIEAIRGFLKPGVQAYLRSIVDHFDQQGQYEYSSNLHHREPEEQQYYESFVSEENGDETENELSRDSVITKRHRLSPRKIIQENELSSEENKESYSKDVTPLRRSPRKLDKKTSEKNVENGPGNTELLLKSFPSVLVKPEIVRGATAAARKSNKPGYTLCYKLLLGVFSEVTIANSRGQGITKPKEGETRPPLDKEKVEAIKEFSIKWCKKNEKPVPIMAELNNAITEQVSHCRKKLKKTLNKN